MNFAQRLFRSVYPCANRDWHHPRFIQMSPISLWDPEPWIWAAQTFGALRIPLIADKSGPTHPDFGSCTGRVWNCRSSTPKPASTSSAQIENRTSDWKRNWNWAWNWEGKINQELVYTLQGSTSHHEIWRPTTLHVITNIVQVKQQQACKIAHCPWVSKLNLQLQVTSILREWTSITLTSLEILPHLHL